MCLFLVTVAIVGGDVAILARVAVVGIGAPSVVETGEAVISTI